MKRLFTILLIICAVAAGASAQFRRAAVVGLNINTLNFKQDLVGVSSTIGYQAGIQGELMFPGIGFGIDVGVLYNQMGAKVNLGDKLVWSSLGYGNEQVYLHQIQIPVHLRFKWTRLNGFEDKLAPFIYGGPDFSITAAHGKCDAFKYAGGDLGLTAGVGVEIYRNWQLSGSYTWGMTYLLKTKLLDDFSAQGRQWAVRLAYYF
jgi:hypothetical protein